MYIEDLFERLRRCNVKPRRPADTLLAGGFIDAFQKRNV
jgi:hypothetical protein